MEGAWENSNYLSVADVAKRLQVSEVIVSRLLEEETIPYITMRGRKYIAIWTLEKYQNHQRPQIPEVKVAQTRYISLEDLTNEFKENEVSSSAIVFLQKWQENKIIQTSANKNFFHLASKIVRLNNSTLTLSQENQSQTTPQLTMAYTRLHDQ